MSFNEQIWDEARDNPEGRSASDEGLMVLAHAPIAERPVDVCTCGYTRHEHTPEFRARSIRRVACEAFTESRGSEIEREREHQQRIEAEHRRAARGVA